MALVKVTFKLPASTRNFTHGGIPFESGMNVEIMDKDLHPKTGKNYFNTTNTKLIAQAFSDKYGSKYSKMSYDFIREYCEAEIL